MKIKISIILMLFAFSFSSAQEIKVNKYRIGLMGGLGKYIQSDLKTINKNVQAQLGFETKLIQDFPMNFYYGGYFLIRSGNKTYIGANYQFHTTGSRMGVKDYSGSYAFDQIISCHSIAFQIEYTLDNSKKLEWCLNAQCGLNISNWKMNEELIIGEEKESLLTELTAVRPFIYPSIKIKYPILNWIYISLSGGFSVDLGGKYNVKDSHSKTSVLKAKWTGPRVSLDLGFSF
ncbi:MAG: hypothetical protein GY756_13190 [bacterium]|nr:hypothetical protein [bacterium]